MDLQVGPVTAHLGSRIYLCGLRLHHGAFGALIALLAIVRGRPLLGALGLALAIHDKGDFPWHTTD